ncbi:MAG: hypothetical protein A3C44_03140 [Gammaproteobacteria bacterium RIFCSPHIGHO2_02_FULL_39_13]|nr:MAG: hypothetical protein A3C44_03140 [Gammaproteobacteria bacterium RIFCSPHIGHO2_02_FULL_39_13]OGT50337.1 MAG: hypothetical protein A3E53_01130 [Gammaproteobacteria bacterium RIFCSPHIGHO2_12_FULL_39_24]
MQPIKQQTTGPVTAAVPAALAAATMLILTTGAPPTVQPALCIIKAPSSPPKVPIPVKHPAPAAPAHENKAHLRIINPHRILFIEL